MMRADNYILENFADFMILLILCVQQDTLMAVIILDLIICDL